MTKKCPWEKKNFIEKIKCDLAWGKSMREENRWERYQRKAKRWALKERDTGSTIYYKALLEKNIDNIFPGAEYRDIERYPEYGDMIDGVVLLPWVYSGNKMDVFFYLEGFGRKEYTKLKYIMDERCIERALVVAPCFDCDFDRFDGMVFLYCDELENGERNPAKKNPTVPLDPNRIG